MIRSQVYLTEEARKSLQTIAKKTVHTQSDLIREAVDFLIARIQNKQNNKLRQETFGLWEDKIDIRHLRKEFERNF